MDQGDGPQRLATNAVSTHLAVAGGGDLQGQIRTGLDTVKRAVGEVGVVDAVGAAGQTGKCQTVHRGGRNALLQQAADRGVEPIGGSKRAVAAAGRLNGAVHVDHRGTRLTDAVGLNVAAEGDVHIGASDEVAAVDANAIGGQHHIGAVIHGDGAGGGRLVSRRAAAEIGASGHRHRISTLDGVGLHEGGHQIPGGGGGCGRGGEGAGGKGEILAAAGVDSLQTDAAVEDEGGRVTLKGVVDGWGNHLHAAGFETSGG